MLKNEQIICIGLPTWEGEYMKSTVQLMTELAKNNDILYVDYPFTLKDLAVSKKAPIKRMLGIENPLRKIELENGQSVNVLTLPPTLPINFIKQDEIYDTLLHANAWQAKRAIKKAMRTLKFHNPVVINAYNPFLGLPLAGQLNEKMLLYYCYDEINASPWCSAHGGRLEAKLMAKADGTIFSSQPLLNAKRHLTKNAFLVKNGVDFQLFNQAVFEEEKPTTFSKENYGKVIGYLGSVDERLDYQLLKETIQSNPNNLFIFVGRIVDENGQRILSQFSNVLLAGSQSPQNLPKWVSLFDVCLIPFVKNKLTAGIYPLKINEYLAAGKPVVTTDFGDLSDFTGMVEVADSQQAFNHAIQIALNLSPVLSIHDRVLFAYENSWEKRAKQMSSIISNLKKRVNTPYLVV